MPPVVAPVKTKAFRLKEGKKHFHDGAAMQPGDTVDLNESQASAFKDKFEAVDASPFAVAIETPVKPVVPPPPPAK